LDGYNERFAKQPEGIGLMPCVLRATGVEFEPETFLRDSSFDEEADPVYHVGEPQSESKPDGRKCETSGFHFGVSEAEFDDLPGQIQDAIRFLEEREVELRRLVYFPGVERVCLDFGIDRRDVAVQVDSFPPSLSSLAGNLGLHLVLSLYPISREEPEDS
jgi:hypothetical protein